LLELRTIPASAEEQNFKLLIIILNKSAASATQFAKYFLLHAYSYCTTAQAKTSYSLFNKQA